MMKIREVITLIAITAISVGIAGESPCESAEKPTVSPIVSQCKEDLAKRLKLDAKFIDLTESKPVDWPDAALGMPEIDKMYAQVITPGLRVVLEAKSTRYLYTTGTKNFKYGGPVSLWSYSMLYIKPNMSDANLNGDLYQCSLMGTNNVLICAGVADFYPQMAGEKRKGIIIAKRRTSRSGHELVTIPAFKHGVENKPKVLDSAFDFGEAAMSDSATEWAGFVRPSIGAEWTVVKDSMDHKRVTLPLPMGASMPGRIAWSGEKVMILMKKGGVLACYETSPRDAKPEWKAIGMHLFPGLTNYMLNKSETLEIDQLDNTAKPTVEVARVWFTGDHNVVATIDDFTLRGNDLFGGFAFIWGGKASETAVYTIDINTGEVIPSYHGNVESIKPFAYHPFHGPLDSMKQD